MRSSSRVRRTGALCAGLLGLLAPLATAGGTAAAQAAPASPNTPTATVSSQAGTYIVTLTASPTAALPVTGVRFDATRPEVARRAQRIVSAQDAVLDAVGGPPVLYRFSTALNGFVAELSAEQVKQLRSRPDVALVERSTRQRVDSVDSPDFLRVPAAWRAVGGPERAGRDTVVGLVDSGIWPENPSFAPLGSGSDRPAGFRGSCETGDEWDESTCSSKVVAARSFVKAFGADNVAASDFLSPRDASGHGSHAAAVAAGNHGVQVRINGQSFGEASGMAPGARIAVYKACWAAPDPDDDGCTTADAVAAVDRAVADGVDVISYAVSGGDGGRGSRTVEQAFLNATAAGVFVATSAGNEGPESGGVAHESPWVTTVGASTHHALQGAVVLGDGTRLVGAMVADQRVRETGLVLGADAPAPGASDRAARLCEMGALDAEKVLGKLVVCDRGTTPRVDKSAEVARAGGVGMVLTNVEPDTVDADIHAVPAVHLDLADAARLGRYVAGSAQPTAALDPEASDDTPIPQVAGFSSRGPAGTGDVLKPDLTAPGVSVLSAASPEVDGRLWDLASGTSASAAHVAGLAAFVLGEHPDWSASQVKSAMSTTARGAEGANDPLAEGAGQVRASGLLDPGLVLDETPRHYRLFAEGRLDGTELNLPSIAVGDLTGTTRVVRRVTNVSGSVQSFSPRVTGLDGISVTVRPRTLTVGPGETARFALQLDSTPGASLERPSSGHLTWTSGRYQARFPVVVQAQAVRAPALVTASGATGSAAVVGTSGTFRDLPLTVSGLVGATPVGLTLEPGGFDVRSPSDGAAAQAFPLDVRAGTEAVRFELDGRDTDDMDLYLYRGDTLVAQASGPGADEELTVVDPEPGSHTLYAHSVAAANHSTTTASLYTWLLQTGDADNLEVPAELTTTAGDRFSFDVAWEELDETQRWFGMLRYGRTDHATLVRVN